MMQGTVLTTLNRTLLVLFVEIKVQKKNFHEAHIKIICGKL